MTAKKDKGCFKTVIAFAIAVLVCGFNVIADENAPGIHIVEIKDLKFIPAEITAKPGDKIRWVNQDFIPHTATAMDQTWDSQNLNRSEMWELEVVTGMAGKYYCLYHPTMKGMILVNTD